MSAGVTASLGRPPRQVIIDGETYELIGPWSRLLTALPTEGWADDLLFMVLHPDDGAVLNERLLDDDDPFGLADLHAVTGQIVRAVCGRPWWEAQRLLAAAVTQWVQVDGTLQLRGVDLVSALDRSPARALNVLYTLLAENLDEKQRFRFDAELTAPPPDEEPTEDMIAAEGQMFVAAMTAHQQSGGSRR